MSNYSSIADLVANVDNATHVINNTAHDDDTVTVASGIDWFTFNNVVVTNLYVSGNSWVGLGTSAEASSIKVDRRDTKLWDFRTETGVVGDHVTFRFLRFRWSGYSYYSSTSASNKLIWDCVLLDNGQIFLNIVSWPTSYTDGTNALVTANTCTYVPSVAATKFTFTRSDNAGTIWTVASGMNEPSYARVLYLYSDYQSYIYYFSSTDNTLTKIDGITRETINAQTFIDHGSSDAAPWSLLKIQLTHPAILKWTDSASPKQINITLAGIPVAQIITTFADLNDTTIKGIKSITSVYEGNISICYSYDNVTWTDNVLMADFLLIDVATLYAGLAAEKKIYFKIKLNDATSRFTNLVIEYIN